MASTYTWEKTPYKGQAFEFSLQGKPKLTLKRKNLFSAQGEAEGGNQVFRFIADGKFDRQITIRDTKKDELFGSLNFRWIDFQKSTLKLENGRSYSWRNHEIFKGAWCWYEAEKAEPAMIFRVDTPFHRSGSVEVLAGKLPSAERDLLLALGLQLQIYLNIWFMIILLVLIGVITG